ncbi:MAG: TRAM domain-containing protein, partial [Spirulinaceae cyanobacterium]
GTKAGDLPNQSPQSVMDERKDILMALQQPIAWRKNQNCIGQTIPVLLEQENPATGELIGRSARFAPEVDGLVYVQGQGALGSIINVKITDADTYDLYGQAASQQDF